MATRVLERNEVSINNIRYPLIGPVRATVTSQYPAKIVIGDTTKESNPRASLITWSSFHGGVGLERINASVPADLNRVWDMECMCLIPGHLVMPFNQTVITPSPGGPITTIGEFNDKLYVTAGSGGDAGKIVQEYDNGWTEKDTLPNAASNVLHYTLGGTEYIAWASDSGYTYYNGTTFVDRTTDAEFLTQWDDRLWGMDNTGQLWYSTTAATDVYPEVLDAKIAVPNNWVQALFTGPDAAGNEIIYVTTRDGLWAHDAANARFVKTHVRWPRHDSAGIQAKTWNGMIYIPVVLSVYEYNPQAGTLRNIGLDRDSGLPAARMGTIEHLQVSHLWLLVGTDNATSSHVWGWNQIGWGSVARSLNDGASDFNAIYTSDVSAGLGTANRLWFAVTTSLAHVTIPASNVSPDEDTSLRWFNSFEDAQVRTPWFDAGQNDLSKIALRINVEVLGADTNETVGVGFATNYVTSFTSLGTISAAGTTTFEFPNSSTPTGTEFRSIQFQLLLNSGSNTATPNVKSVSLEYRKKLNTLYGFEFDVDVSRPYKDSESIQQMRANLVAAVENATKVEFTYREDVSNTRNYYVDVVNVSSEIIPGPVGRAIKTRRQRVLEWLRRLFFR
jgi:hypothetical protein